MAGDNEGRDLVTQLVWRKGGARLGIARRPQHIEQIAWRLRRGMGEAGRDDPIHESPPLAAEPIAGEVPNSGNRRRQKHVEKIGPAETRAEPGDQAAQVCPMLSHLQGEHRSTGDLESQQLHGG